MLKMKRFLLSAGLAMTVLTTPCPAEGWCKLLPGWQVVTHGTKSDEAYIQGQLEGAASPIWIRIATATVGKANVAVALGAQLAGKDMLVYLDSSTATCANFPSWAPIGEIRHLKVLP